SEASVAAVKGLTGVMKVTIGGTGQTFKWYRAEAPGTQLLDGTKYAGAKTATLTVKGLLDTDAGEYICDVFAPDGATTKQVMVGIRKLQVVTSPTSTFIAAGTSLIRGVTSVGPIAPGDLSYQWKKNAVNILLTANATAQSPTFEIGSAVLANFGGYTCVVTPTGGTACTTVTANVAVANLSATTVHVNITKTAILKATATGLGVTYKWYRRDGGVTALANGSKYTGVTTASLSIIDCQVADDGEYFCEISANGVMLTAGDVSLLVHRAPVLGAVVLPTGIVSGVYNYQVPVDADPLRQPTSYKAVGLPTGLTMGLTTGIIAGKPTVTASGANVTITATNGAGSATDTFPITINAMPAYLAGAYTGPIPRNADINGGLGGAFNMTVTGTGGASGSLMLGTVSRAFTGSLNVIGTDTATATATASISTTTGTPQLTVTFDIGSNTNLLTNGVVTNGVSNSAFHGWRKSFSTGSPATIYQGLYNFGAGLPTGDPNIGSTSVPQGQSIAWFTVNNLGAMSIIGSMADGTAVAAFATFIGPNGEFFLYKSLYATALKGSVLAELDIDDQGTPGTSDNTLTGISGTWSRPADPATRNYKDGFGPVNLAAEGGRYDPPVPPQLILGVTTGANNASLAFTDLGTADTSPDVHLSIQTGNTITFLAPNPATTRFTSTPASIASTGQFKGDFILQDDDPTTGTVNANELSRTGVYSGIIYPQGGVLIGAGYVSMPQLPSTADGTTPTTSPILSGTVIFDQFP
ncbi:MAG: hypothetical protein U0984_08425, partial [Prosthecobacter sp.]|nr:hypothetical protein [Prosthecobacter sp.]